jgi:aspartyl protease family protein
MKSNWWVSLCAMVLLAFWNGMGWSSEQLPLNGLIRREGHAALSQPASEHTLQLLQAGRRGLFIRGEVNGSPGLFMIDTAASHTVLSPAVAERAGIDPNVGSGSARVITANGSTRLPLVVVRTLAVGEHQAHNLTVVVQVLDPSLGIDGLLGLDFLSQFNFSLSSRTLILQGAQ